MLRLRRQWGGNIQQVVGIHRAQIWEQVRNNGYKLCSFPHRENSSAPILSTAVAAVASVILLGNPNSLRSII